MTEYVDNMWSTLDTEELNPKEKRGEEEKKRRFRSKIVMLLTKDTQLITGGRHFIS